MSELLEKSSKESYVYLGGSHKDTSNWRVEFQHEVDRLTNKIENKIVCVDPFKRDIDEKSQHTIVSRDLTILSDERLTHIVLMSDVGGGVLSTGASCELILSRHLEKPVVVVSLSGNDWIHPFVLYFANYVTSNIKDAAQWIVEDKQSEREHTCLDDACKAIATFRFDMPDESPFRN